MIEVMTKVTSAEVVDSVEEGNREGDNLIETNKRFYRVIMS